MARTGRLPLAGLIADASGNLYGTTYSGGASGVGTVFEVAAGQRTDYYAGHVQRDERTTPLRRPDRRR